MTVDDAHRKWLRKRREKGYPVRVLEELEASIPDLSPDAVFYFDHWTSLMRTRPIGMATSPISNQEFLAHCHLHSIPASMRLRIWDVVQYLEDVSRELGEEN